MPADGLSLFQRNNQLRSGSACDRLIGEGAMQDVGHEPAARSGQICHSLSRCLLLRRLEKITALVVSVKSMKCIERNIGKIYDGSASGRE